MQEKKPSPKDFFKRFTKKSPPKTAKHTAKGPNQRLRQRAAVLIIVILVIGFGATLLRLGLLTVVQGSDLQERAVDQQLADTTLTAIAEQRPLDEAGLVQISGIGPAKIDKFGAEVLALVRGESPYAD